MCTLSFQTATWFPLTPNKWATTTKVKSTLCAPLMWAPAWAWIKFLQNRKNRDRFYMETLKNQNIGIDLPCLVWNWIVIRFSFSLWKSVLRNRIEWLSILIPFVSYSSPVERSPWSPWISHKYIPTPRLKIEWKRPVFFLLTTISWCLCPQSSSIVP